MQSTTFGERQEPLAGRAAQNCALLIIPVAIVFIPLIFKGNLGPYYLGDRSDPAYVYLFNSLVVTCGHTPPYFDHPGTPLVSLGAAIIALKASLQGQMFCPISQVLTQPESFLNWVNDVLLVLLAIACFAFSARILRLTSNVYAALAAQIALLGSVTLVATLDQPTPEILLTATVFVLGYCLAPVIFESEKKYPRTALLSGAIVGFGLATKITLFPLLLYALMFKEIRTKTAFALAAAVSFIFFTLLIARSYLKFVAWIWNIAVHSESYGEGPVGLPSVYTLAGRGLAIIEAEPLTFAIAAASLLLVGFMYLRACHARLEGAARFILLTLAVLAVQMLATMKHFELRYTVPALAASAVSSSVALVAIGAIRERLSAIAFVVMLAIATPKLTMNLNRFLADSYAADQIENAKIVEMGSTTCGRIIPYYRSSSQQYALSFGNGFVGSRFSADLARLYPDFISYDIWNSTFETFSRIYNLSQIAYVPHSKSFCLSGTIDLPYYANGRPNVRFISKQGNVNLYELPQQ
jgi:hypothetical protein